MKLHPIALANTLAVIDLIVHPAFHLWAAISPDSLEYLMHVFVAGLELNIDPALDLSPLHLVLGTLLEASAFWITGYVVATLYNTFVTKGGNK